MTDGTTTDRISQRPCPNCERFEWFTDMMTDWTIACCQYCGEMYDIRFISPDVPLPDPVAAAIREGHTLDELIRDFRKRWRAGAVPSDAINGHPCAKCGSDMMDWEIGSPHGTCAKCGTRMPLPPPTLAHAFAAVFRRGSIIHERHMGSSASHA